MIASTQDYELTREQLGRAERALASLRETVLPKSKEQYRLMSEAYIEEIRKLRGQIDAYLGLAPDDQLASR